MTLRKLITADRQHASNLYVDTVCFMKDATKLCSVATKIENGPKTKMKNLRIWKIDRRRRRRFFGILKNLRRPSKIGISSKIFEEPKIFRRIERKMRNLKSMYCEKNSDEIDHYKNFGHQKFFSFSIQKINPFSSIFPQNFFNKR